MVLVSYDSASKLFSRTVRHCDYGAVRMLVLEHHFFLSDFHLTRFPVSLFFPPLFLLLFAQRLS